MDDVTLTKTLCSVLGGITGWAWRETGPYAADEVAVFYGPLLPSPDRAVGVRVYRTEDNTRQYLRARRVQVRVRGARGRPDGADELSSAVHAALEGLSRTGGVSGVTRLSMAPLGADENGREERTENYLITIDNLEA